MVTNMMIHEVVPGDTLYDIAKSVYCDGDRWRDIWCHNRHIIANPDLIYPGLKLKLPYATKKKFIDIGIIPLPPE